tara:strand:+ start:182 stop:553 length:372 start_codon:yes stop_codon:yes gene_type:complete
MAHFAEINSENVVIRVIVAEQDFIDSGAVGDSSNWIQTSYNTRRGVHYAPNSHTPDDGVALRKNYAGVGMTYDRERDAFIPIKPYDSWLLNDDTCQWDAPVAYPDDGKFYKWNEDGQSWDLSE